MVLHQFSDLALSLSRHHFLIVIHAPAQGLTADDQVMTHFHHFLFIQQGRRLMQPVHGVLHMVLAQDADQLLLGFIKLLFRLLEAQPLFLLLLIPLPVLSKFPGA